MKNTKTIFSKIVSMMAALLSLALVLSFSVVEASAAEVPASAITGDSVISNISNVSSISSVIISPIKADNESAGASLASQTDGDSQFEAVVNFFVKWIKRVGLLVAFVGGVMFALAIKNNDAEQKQAGLLTLVAGFVVSALCQAVDMFDIFS